MLLEIDDWRTVSDIQYRFNKCFPYLHLQLFDNRDKEAGPVRTPAVLLSTMRGKHDPGVLSIKSWHTKRDVEAMLRQQFGLLAKVVGLMGERELELLRPGFTLQQLNEQMAARQPHLSRSQPQDDLEFIEGW